MPAAFPIPPFNARLALIDDFLDPGTFNTVCGEIGALVDTERSFLPAHKKGGTVAYSTLRKNARALVQYYLSAEMSELVSGIVGSEVLPTPDHDESSCSVLFYDKPGDHIGWHFDHNFYRGRHFTVLIPIVNRGPSGLSAARLTVQRGSTEQVIATPPNRMIIFEGARIRHKVTPIAAGEKRVVWSMTYCANPRNSILQGLARRVKDTAFFGLRALWT